MRSGSTAASGRVGSPPPAPYHRGDPGWGGGKRLRCGSSYLWGFCRRGSCWRRCLGGNPKKRSRRSRAGAERRGRAPSSPSSALSEPPRICKRRGGEKNILTAAESAALGRGEDHRTARAPSLAAVPPRPPSLSSPPVAAGSGCAALRLPGRVGAARPSPASAAGSPSPSPSCGRTGAQRRSFPQHIPSQPDTGFPPHPGARISPFRAFPKKDLLFLSSSPKEKPARGSSVSRRKGSTAQPAPVPIPSDSGISPDPTTSCPRGVQDGERKRALRGAAKPRRSPHLLQNRL